jgi:hypothetical protein
MIALDHDEYGAEHIVLAPGDRRLRRVHHVFVYPRDEDTGEPYVEAEPILTEVQPVDPPQQAMTQGTSLMGQRPAPRWHTCSTYRSNVSRPQRSRRSLLRKGCRSSASHSLPG